MAVRGVRTASFWRVATIGRRSRRGRSPPAPVDGSPANSQPLPAEWAVGQVGRCRSVQRLQVSPDGNWLASCGDDGAIHIWDLEGGDLLRTQRRDRPYERLDISGAKGLTQAQRASLRALGAIEDAPTRS